MPKNGGWDWFLVNWWVFSFFSRLKHSSLGLCDGISFLLVLYSKSRKLVAATMLSMAYICVMFDI